MRDTEMGIQQRPRGYPGHWTGRFIWVEGESHPFHFFLMARKRFQLAEAPANAALHITANDRYVLTVNGTYLGRGPARSDCRWKSFDSYDLAGQLRPGQNVVAVLAYRYGCNNNYSRDDRAGLFAQLELTQADGGQRVVGTDDSWRVRPAQGWRRDVRPINICVGVTEVYDARLDPGDWTDAGFDDSQWAAAYVIPDSASPWSCLEPRQTPMMREREIFPVSIVETGEILEDKRTASDADVPEQLAAEPHLPLQYTRIDQPEALPQVDTGRTIVQSVRWAPGDPPRKGVRSPYLVFDFGRQVFGFPRVRLNGTAGGVVDMTYGHDLVGGRIQPLAGHMRYGDRTVMREGPQSWQPFEYKQFRYLQIVFRQIEQPVSIDSVSLISYEYPAPRRGQFACSDEVLTRLWTAAVDTTYLQMEDTILCDAFRERSSWGGDGAHGHYAVWAGFGDTAISDRHFRLLSRGQMADGMWRDRYPCTEGPLGGGGDPGQAAVYDNPGNIPQHALVVAVMLTGDYRRYFGRHALLEELYPRLAGLAGWCERHADDTGLLYGLANWNWVDWSPSDLRGANFQTNAFYFQMLANLASIARDMGQTGDAVRWASQAAQVRDSLRRLHWSPEQSAFVDSVFEGQQSSVISEVANGLALLFDIASGEQRASIVRHIGDPQSSIARATPLFFYYVIEGLLGAGAEELALRLLRERYTPMLAYASPPSIWESWLPYALDLSKGGPGPARVQMSSFTHPGGVGPAWTLSKHLLGVTAGGPGLSGCRIAPITGGLDWARGVFPSIHGDISVEWRKEVDSFTLEVTLPAGLESELAVPRVPGRAYRLAHDRDTVMIPADASEVPGLDLSEDHVALTVTGGHHRLELVAE